VLWIRRAGLVLGCLLLLDCGRPTIQPSAAPLPHLFEGHPGSSPLSVEARERAPTLQTIAREGDPSGAVSLSIQTENSREALGLEGLLRSRLRTELPDSIRVHGLGVTLTRFVRNGKQAEDFLRNLKTALEEPVSGDSAALTRVNQLLEKQRTSPPSRSEVDACLGVLGADGPDAGPMSVEELESIRQLAGVARLGLGALGSQEIREAAIRVQKLSWAPGTPLRVRDARARSLQMSSGPKASVRVAVRTPRVAEAFAVANSLSTGGHALGAKVEALGRGFSYQDAHVTSDAEGACLGVTLVQDDAITRTSLDALAEMAVTIRSELEVALDGPKWREPGLLGTTHRRAPLRAQSGS
jgi:hypothetical protein